LLEAIAVSDPPVAAERLACEKSIREVLECQVTPELSPLLARTNSAVQLVGTGGTSTILARIQLRLRTFRRDLIEGALLSAEQVQTQKSHLWSLPLDQRKSIIGLPPNRADVILSGAAIFAEVMSVFDLNSLRVSTRGMRFAALME
ncbi:MAG TPA: hypothetical protein VK633_14870, partial [Verrucomicrobiae bacterium]|nr:hypothetical protein [Verrucomicrobiae bacterium]